MTDIQIRECFGIASSAPDRVLLNDEEILQSIKNNIGFTKIFDDNRVNDVLQEIRQEIEKPLHDERCFDTADAKAQYIALNWVCELIDKHIKQIEGSDTE